MSESPERKEFLKSVGKTYEKDEPSLLRFIARRIPKWLDPRDILHNAVLRLLERRNPAPIEELRPYLRRTVRGLISDIERKDAPRADSCEDDIQHPIADESGTLVDIEAISELLPSTCREVLLRSRRDGKTYDQIADELGLTHNQVHRCMSKALDEFRRLQSHTAQESGRGKRRRRGKLVKKILSLAVLTLILAPIVHEYIFNKPLVGSYVTALGEHRCASLPDTSQVCLNTNSAVRFKFNQRARQVEVVSGEVLFKVRPGDPRPFDVLSGHLLVHDVSTSFDVYKRPRSTQVTVVDGSVRLAAPLPLYAMIQFHLALPRHDWSDAPEIRKSQQVVFDEATGKLTTRPALSEKRLTQLLKWQEGRIDLDGIKLSEALEEFARYQSTPRFSYSESLGNKVVGGTMGITGLEDFLEALQIEFHIKHRKTERDGDPIVELSIERDPDSHPRK